MIEGIKVVMTSAELKEHLLARANYHEIKAVAYKGKHDILKIPDGDYSSTSMNPVNQLADNERYHREKATYFKFLADHIPSDEIYHLDEGDLSSIEVGNRY